MLSVTPAMLRTISGSVPPNSALGRHTRGTLVRRSLVAPCTGSRRLSSLPSPLRKEHALYTYA
jgi:hypothetical protein